MKNYVNTVPTRSAGHPRATKLFRTIAVAALVLMAGVGSAIAQSRVSGTVRSSAGDPMAGVMVTVKGTQTVAITDAAGAYSISVPDAEATLVYSLLGHLSVEQVAGTRGTIDVALAEDAQQIDQVVVTALGILRKEKTLTYSTQVVGGDELTRVKDPNMINSLAGKTAGVQISRSSAGVGGSVRVVIRGGRSAEGNNQPLYVIDGMPINSSSNAGWASTMGGDGDAGTRDTGDGISGLNPDDIESMNILKGPAAAALYGNRAANGVVVITTKKGKAGRTEVTFNSNTTFDSAVHGRPEFQDSFGGENMSWGDPISKKSDYIGQFLRTGVTTINSLSLSAGNETVQSYFSYANTYAKGVTPGNELKKHNFTFRETGKFFDNRLTADANVSMMYQQTINPTNAGAFYMNPLVGLYTFPRGGAVQGSPEKSFEYYKENYTRFDPARNLDVQNWHKATSTWEQNPFWLANKQPSDDRRFRTIANLSLAYKVNDNLTIQARGNADYRTAFYELKMYAGTDPGLVSKGNGANGRYRTEQSYGLDLYGDVMASYQKDWDNWSMSATAGASIKDGHGRSNTLDSYMSGLWQANVFTANNIITPARPEVGKWRGPQEQAVFFAGQVGWKDQLYLDVTARNDWSSTLAYTDYVKQGFFYPSVGASWLVNESFELPKWISLGKVRAAWSQVGNSLRTSDASNPMNSINFGPDYAPNTTAPFGKLRPEMTTSIEAGTEWRLFGSRVEFDFTYYKTNTRDQLFNMAAESGSEYNRYWVNAGNIQNQGVEIVLAGTPVLTNDFVWRTGFNFSANRNKVLELVDGLSSLPITDGGTTNYAMRLEKGGSFGDIYGRSFMRENGKIVYDDKGLPRAAEGDYVRLGNAAPRFNLGWQNTISWKGIALNFLIDGRFGGNVMSLTQAELDSYGVTKRTGDDRKRGYVEFDGKQIKDVQGFYSRVGGRAGITEHYLYDATNIRLRELSLGYSLPAKWFEKTGWIRGADVSLVGRNLCFLLNKAPYDPDVAMFSANNNGLQGVDIFGMPGMRSFGFNIKLNF